MSSSCKPTKHPSHRSSAAIPPKRGTPRRKLYTAWDNLKDEHVFFRGVDRLQRAGIPPTLLRVYMLIGYDKAETWQRIFHRFERMTAMGSQPFVMVKDRARLDLRAFQRWANLGLYRIIPWAEYRAPGKVGFSLSDSRYAGAS